ncbi:MAG: leucyl/phenylalanyl-tRNA--protein transferase [Dissulfuribacterales bacterium]
MSVFLLNQEINFPPPELADATGLLAIGGDLRFERLILAYVNGIFPWYNADEPILWWSPNPRLVLFPAELHVSKRLKRTLRANRFQITFDAAFEQTIRACGESRLAKGEDTWLNEDMIQAYITLHQMGIAHSVEAWFQNELAGGLYGVAIGQVFYGESMWTKVTDASKTAFVTLVQRLMKWDFQLIDCQVTTTHLLSFGAKEIPRSLFLKLLHKYVRLRNTAPIGCWMNETVQPIDMSA